jgi:RelB Antitoxin alpha helical domain
VRQGCLFLPPQCQTDIPSGFGVERVADWPHSSFHRFVRLGVYPGDWVRTFIGDFNMLEFHKSIVVDENQKPVAVQIPFDEFQRIEEVIENFGLAKLMDETESDERLAGDAAKEYYESLKASDVAG